MDTEYRYRKAAQHLGIAYYEIDDTPEYILEAAWQEWWSEYCALARLRAQSGIG